MIRKPRIGVLILGILFLFSKNTMARVSESLFFMGEDLDVLTIASGRPEFPKNAPAIAEVINSKKLNKKGIITLSEILSQSSGFYLEQKEWGHELFFRGIPSSILFLYDGVPLRSDSTKNIYPLDFELPIASIKRIEIVKGPASVLWGPDAFAGVINLVPKTGKDLNGIESGVTYGGPDNYRSVFFNIGKDSGTWNGFLSFSSSFVEPYKKSVYINNQDKELNTQKYISLIYNMNFLNSFNISGRLSYYDKPYPMKDISTNLEWDAKKNNPFNLIKLKWKKEINDNTAISLMSYYNFLYQKREELDIKWKQKNNIYYFEAMINRDLYDRHGLITIGTSYKINSVIDADIRTRTFLPHYIEHKTSHFDVLIDNASFTTRLFSIFSQYRHHLNKIDIWAGARFDYHSEYHSSITYNLGFLWRQNEDFYIKAIYGTAYRTPYATQFLRDTHVNPEEIKTLNMELNYSKQKRFTLSLIPFYNIINHHITEDTYGGYSRPNSQKILGCELNITYRPFKNLTLFANTTFFNTWGKKEIYYLLDYITITPSGEVEKQYTKWSKEYNYGTDKIINLGVNYNINKNTNFYLNMRYIGKRNYIYKDNFSYNFPSVTTFDLNINFKRIFKNINAFIAVKNLFDKKYKVPGKFSPIDCERFKLYAGIKYVF